MRSRDVRYSPLVSYRDDQDAMHAKIGQLEHELATARDQIAKLEGRSVAPGPATSPHSAVLAGPRTIALVRELPFEIDEAGFEEIANAVRSRMGAQVLQVGRTLHGGQFLTVRSAEGKTVVRVSASLSVLAALPFVGGGIAGTFAAMLAAAFLHDFAHLSGPAILLHLAWIVPLVGGSAGWVSRALTRRLAQRSLRLYQGVFETTLAIAERHTKRAGPRVRIEAPIEHDSQVQEQVASHDSIEKRKTS
jgi:hypothetical protein